MLFISFQQLTPSSQVLVQCETPARHNYPNIHGKKSNRGELEMIVIIVKLKEEARGNKSLAYMTSESVVVFVPRRFPASSS